MVVGVCVCVRSYYVRTRDAACVREFLNIQSRTDHHNYLRFLGYPNCKLVGRPSVVLTETQDKALGVYYIRLPENFSYVSYSTLNMMGCLRK